MARCKATTNSGSRCRNIASYKVPGELFKTRCHLAAHQKQSLESDGPTLKGDSDELDAAISSIDLNGKSRDARIEENSKAITKLAIGTKGLQAGIQRVEKEVKDDKSSLQSMRDALDSLTIEDVGGLGDTLDEHMTAIQEEKQSRVALGKRVDALEKRRSVRFG